MSTAVEKNGEPITIFENEQGRKLWGKLCSHIGVDPKAAQHKLGSGTQGTAYELPNGRVLKLTWDSMEAKAAALVARSPDPEGNVVAVDTVVGVSNGQAKIWAIVMEKLQKMSQDDPFTTYTTIWNEWSSQSEPPRNVLPKAVDQFMTDAEKEYKLSDPEWESFKVWIENVAAYLKQTGIAFHDLWPGNVMVRGGQHVLIDLGYSKSNQELPIDVISRLLALARRVEAFS